MVVAKSLESSRCSLDRPVLEKLLTTILAEVKAAGFGAGMPTEELEYMSVSSILESVLKKDQKFTFDGLYPDRGRFSRLPLPKEALSIENSAYHEVRHVDYLIYRSLPFGMLYSILQSMKDLLEKNLSLDNLMKNGIVATPKTFCSSGLSNSCSENAIISDSTSTHNYYMSPINVQFFAYNPTSVLMKSAWRMDTFGLSWSYKGNTEKSTFSFVRPEQIEATFPANLEFTMAFKKRVRAWVSLLSFGINSLLDDNTVQSSYNTDKFNVKFIGSPDTFKPKEPLVITISDAQATEYLESLADLNRLKLKLGRGYEMQSLLKNATEELNNATEELIDNVSNSDPIGLISLAQNLQQLNTSNIANTPNSIELVTMVQTVRQYNMLDPKSLNILDESTQKGILVAVEKQRQKFIDHATFSSLEAKPKDLKGVLGFVFEEFSAGQIEAAAAKKGVVLTRIAGDGEGLLANRLTTPEFSDLVYVDQNGKHYSFQLKCSDTKTNIVDMVKKLFTTHGRRVVDSRYPTGFDLIDTIVVVPKGLNPGPIEVNILDPSTGKNKIITPTSVIEIGGVKAEVPSFADLKKVFRQHYPTIRKLSDQGILGALKESQIKIRELQKSLAVERNKLNPPSSPTNNNRRPNQPPNQQYTQIIQDKIQQLEIDLKVYEDILKANTKLIENAVEKSITVVRRKTMLKTVAYQCLAGILVDGVTSFVKSYHSNKEAWERNEITTAQFAGRVAADTGIAAGIGFGISAPITLGFIGLQYMARSATSTAVATSGKVLERVLGPAIILGFMAYEVSKSLKELSRLLPLKTSDSL